MKKYLKKMFGALLVLVCVTSCSKEDLVQDVGSDLFDKIAVSTEVIIDGVDVTNTRAASEAGYTTGDGLYNRDDRVVVAAHANDGYELVRFYDKGGNASQQNESSYTFSAKEPQTFRAEFASKRTISVDIIPVAGGTVAGAGSYATGSTCTLTAAPNAGYDFGGWYDGKNLLSASNNYAFTVTASKNITAHFLYNRFILVGEKGYIVTPYSSKQVGNGHWDRIAYGNGKYVVVGSYISSSLDGENWEMPQHPQQVSATWNDVIYTNGKFVAVGYDGNIAVSTDGTNWSVKRIMAPKGYYPEWKGITYGNGKFVVAGLTGTSLGFSTTSIDGENWTYPTSVGESTYEPRSIGYGNGKYIITGSAGGTYYSVDGLSWSFLGGLSGYADGGLKYGNGKFVGVVYNKIYYASGDVGNSWSQMAVGENTWWNGIGYDNGTFIIVGENGYFSRSIDAINWTTPSKSTTVTTFNGACGMP